MLKPRIIQKQQPQVFYKKTVLRNFAIFKGKHSCWSLLLNKVGDVKACSFIKKRCFYTFMFLCEYCEILKSIYLAEYLRAFIFQRTHVFQKQKQRNIWKSSSHVFLYLFITIVTPVGTTLIENRLANSSFFKCSIRIDHIVGQNQLQYHTAKLQLCYL